MVYEFVRGNNIGNFGKRLIKRETFNVDNFVEKILCKGIVGSKTCSIFADVIKTTKAHGQRYPE